MNLPLLMLALALSTGALAQAQPAPEWTVVQPQSKLGFAASMNGDGFAGSFARWAARIRFDPARLAASRVAVVVDMRSARTGDTTRDEALPSSDWFAVARFPQAIFTASRFRALGGNRYVADGSLKLRDKSAPLSLPFTLTIAGSTATMKGSAIVDRRTFGVGQGQFATADPVATSVRIDVSLVARRN